MTDGGGLGLRYRFLPHCGGGRFVKDVARQGVVEFSVSLRGNDLKCLLFLLEETSEVFETSEVCSACRGNCNFLWDGSLGRIAGRLEWLAQWGASSKTFRPNRLRKTAFTRRRLEVFRV